MTSLRPGRHGGALAGFSHVPTRYMRRLTRRTGPVCSAQLGGQPEAQGSAAGEALGGEALKHLTELERVKELQRRKRISQANKGRTPWNKGRRHSPETIAKIRAGTTKAMARPEVRAKLEAFNETQRRPHDEETKAKIRAVLQERSRATRSVISEQCDSVLAKMAGSEDAAVREAAAYPEAHALLCSLAWSFMKKDWAQLADKWDADPEFRDRALQRIRSRMIKVSGEQQRAAKPRNKVRVAVETLTKLREARAKLEQAETALANLQRVKAALAGDPARQLQAAAAELQAQEILEKLRGQVESLTMAMGPLAKYLAPVQQDGELLTQDREGCQAQQGEQQPEEGAEEGEDGMARGPRGLVALEQDQGQMLAEEQGGQQGGSGGGGGAPCAPPLLGPSMLGEADSASAAGVAGSGWPVLGPKQAPSRAAAAAESSNGAVSANGTVAAACTVVAFAAPWPVAAVAEDDSSTATCVAAGSSKVEVPPPSPAAAIVPTRGKDRGEEGPALVIASSSRSSNGAATVASSSVAGAAAARQQAVVEAGSNRAGSALGVSIARPTTSANAFSWARLGQGQAAAAPPAPANGTAAPLAGRTLARNGWGSAGTSTPLRLLPGPAAAAAASAPGLEPRLVNGRQAAWGGEAARRSQSAGVDGMVASESDAQEVPAPRRRGRPRKDAPAPTAAPAAEQAEQEALQQEEQQRPAADPSSSSSSSSSQLLPRHLPLQRVGLSVRERATFGAVTDSPRRLPWH